MRNKDDMLLKKQRLFIGQIAMNGILITSSKRIKQDKNRMKEDQNNIIIRKQNWMIYHYVANFNHNMDLSNPTVLANVVSATI